MKRTLLLLAVLAAAGCGGAAGGHQSAPTTPPRAPTTSIDPDVVPAVITPAYVNAVFVELNHVYGNASREIVATHQISAEDLTMLRAIFNDPLYTAEVTVATQSATAVPGDLREPLGDRVTTVVSLDTASKACIFAKTTTNYSAVLTQPPPQLAAEYYELQPKQPGADPQRLNPTPWAISGNQVFTSEPRTTLADPCARA